MSENNNSYFDEKTVLITGASTGIGRAVAKRFCSLGASVAGTARSEDKLRETMNEASDLGGSSLALPGDVRDAERAGEIVSSTVDEFGSVDVLVNNAGLTRDQLVLRMSEEDWEDVINVNLGGTFHFTKEVAGEMIRQRSGRIINVSSVVGLRGNPGQSNYVASKAGIAGFTKSVARELGSRGITVNAVAPGYVETPMTDDMSEEDRQDLIEEIPLERLGKPDDIAGAIKFLAGPEAGYITGQVIVVDGGMYT